MVSYRGASADGKEIIMVLIFGAGVLIIFYMLIKKEISGLFGDAGKGIYDTINNSIAKVKEETNQIMYKTESSAVYVKDALRTQEEQIKAIQSPLIQLGLDPTVVPGMGSTPNQIIASYTRIPVAKLYKNGKWYILKNCDITGYNCEDSYEAGVFDFATLTMATDVTNL